MKSYFTLIPPVAILLALVVFAMPVRASTPATLNLPAAPLQASHMRADSSYFEVALGGVGAGFEIVDSLVYNGWCLEPDKELNAELVTPINSIASDLPGGLSAAPFDWPRINYLLNHKQGTGMQVQQALWALIDGSPTSDFTVQAMLNDAILNGADYVPQAGEVVAVILYADGVENIASNLFQDTLIEVVVPGTPQFAAFGGSIWYDTDKDGIQREGESGAVGVPVSLYACNGTLVATTSTGENGAYGFTGLPPGDYFAQFVPLTGFALSPQNVGEDDTDSDADANAETGCTTLAAGENELSWDAGIYLPQPPNVGTGTASYWKNHPEVWPAGQVEVGAMRYTNAVASNMMVNPVKRDTTYIVFDALLAARLNAARGAEAGCIAGTIAAADAWLAGYPVGSGVTRDSSAWQTGEPLQSTLDAYNNGLLCAPSRNAIGAKPVAGVEQPASLLFMPSLAR